MPFSVATWNILANSHIRREFYPRTPRQVLDPAWRVPELARRAAALGVDILCLQEVEEPMFVALEASLGATGYKGAYARKGLNRPDGCATFHRDHFKRTGEQRIQFADGNGGPDSGHICQLIALDDSDGRRLAVLNTHLKWGHTDDARQVGHRQIVQVIASLALAGAVNGRIVSGDFNVMEDSDIVKTLRSAGMDFAHRDRPEIASCNPNGKAKLIDYLFFGGPLRAKPILPEPIDDMTILPSADHPSDHLPLVAEFEWTNELVR